MWTRFRKQAPGVAIGLVLILPALGGGNSLLFGWPHAALLFTLVLALMLTDPDMPRRLPWWYWTLGAGLALLGLLWLWPGSGLIALSPSRAQWPGPSGEISGLAANRVGTRDSLFQALGFFAVLGIALLALDRPARRRNLMRWMLLCLGLVFVAALLIHFLQLNSHILPDVLVTYRDRLNYPFGGANLAAAFFVSSLPFAVGLWLVHSPEERYLPIRRVWQMVGTVALLSMLALQVMTQNRWMWVCLTPLLLGSVTWYVLRRRSRRRRVRAMVGILLFTILAATFLSFFNPGGVVSRFLLATEQDDSSQIRLLAWQNAWNTFREYPWVGIGPGGFAEVYPTTAPAGIHFWIRYVHCEPLQWLAETGILGLALLLAVASGMLHTLWRQYRERVAWQERAPFAVAGLLIAMACLIDFPLRCPAILFLFALYLGATLATDRTSAELAAETTPNLPSALTGPRGWHRRLPALALPILLLSALIGFLPAALNLFCLGPAMARYHAQSRSFQKDQDGTAYAAAAADLLANAGNDPYVAGQALSILAGASDSPGDWVRWSPQIKAILTACPYHDSLYSMQAAIVLFQGDDAAAAALNAKARLCAATNINALQRVATMDWTLAVSAADPGLRAARLRTAQETTRWLLTGSPERAVEMADTCRRFGLRLEDFLPALPAAWDRPADLCRICMDRDRPLTALDLIARNDLYARAAASSKTSASQPLTRWDLEVLTATGQVDALGERVFPLYRETAPSLRPGLLAEVRRQGWGLLTPTQWNEFALRVENSLPSAMERFQLGQLYLQLGQRGRASQIWLQAYKQDRRPELALALAQVYYAGSAGSLAVEYAKEAVDLDEKNPAAWRLLALILVANRDFPAAQRAFDRYMALDPVHALNDTRLRAQILAGHSPPAAVPGSSRPAP